MDKIEKSGLGCMRWLIIYDPEIELNIFLEDCRKFPNFALHLTSIKDVEDVIFKELEQDATQESSQGATKKQKKSRETR